MGAGRGAPSSREAGPREGAENGDTWGSLMPRAEFASSAGLGL